MVRPGGSSWTSPTPSPSPPGSASLGRCDVVVNNAGGALGVTQGRGRRPRRVGADVCLERGRHAAGDPGRAAAAAESARATIVDISSIAGERVYEGGAGYVAAKHGTSVVSETLRLELNGENIRVVDIRPGMVRTEEFSLTRLHGDRAAADKVYDGVDRPLVAADVAECVGFVIGLPQHVNIDTMVIKPVAQAAPHKIHRGAIDWKDA